MIPETISRQVGQPRWLTGLRRSRVHSLMIARQSLCPEKLGSNPGQGNKEINFRAGMVSICPLLWQRDVKTKQIINGKWTIYLGTKFVFLILDSDSRSGFWNRSMDFLKFAIAGELLVVPTCKLYQTNLCQVDYRSRILDPEHILS